MGNQRCACCGLDWLSHKGIMGTCRELHTARKQLVDLRVTFFILCLKYLPPEAEFTPENLLTAMLKNNPHHD